MPERRGASGVMSKETFSIFSVTAESEGSFSHYFHLFLLYVVHPPPSLQVGHYFVSVFYLTFHMYSYVGFPSLFLTFFINRVLFSGDNAIKFYLPYLIPVRPLSFS